MSTVKANRIWKSVQQALRKMNLNKFDYLSNHKNPLYKTLILFTTEHQLHKFNRYPVCNNQIYGRH